jgi:tyramine---L-glutamate ligase
MKRLKILVFEYITGGGLNKSELPEALAGEGLLMLQALLDNLAEIDAIEPIVMLDYRMIGKLNAKPINTHIIRPEHDCAQAFTQVLQDCDAAWPIAPETDFILQNLCEMVEQLGKLLLTSPASAVSVAANKWLAYEHLRQHSIATVNTQKLTDFNLSNDFNSGEWVIKSLDGVGCEDSYLITDQVEFVTLVAALDTSRYIIQPHLQGKKTSLSCLFKQGQGWLVCANCQHFTINNQQYHLAGISVNFTGDTARYGQLVSAVAKAMPDLWGYAGIDLIETDDQILVLEVNPRLTTSYAGIKAACGINCAQAILDLLTGDPYLQQTHNHSISIKVANQEYHAN